MRFHSRKLFRAEFAPRALSYAIRRSPAHSPEGVLRVDAPPPPNGGPQQPITVFTALLPTGGSMGFALNAETRVAFGGERLLHGWLNHRFSNSGSGSINNLTLVASARQFSSFIVLVGRIASADTFEPIAGSIVKDKDELRIPLAVSELPTPKEFKDAIGAFMGTLLQQLLVCS